MSMVTTRSSPGFVTGARRWRRRHPMSVFVLKRVAIGVATLAVLSFFMFLATNALPGNVAEVVLGKDATPARLMALEQQLGLDRPLLARYLSWVGGVLHGDLGQSAVALAQGANSASVVSRIAEPLRNSLVIAALSIALLIPLSLLAGTIAAVYAGRAVDQAVSYGSLIVISLPEIVLGTFLIVIFFTQFDLLPPVALVPPGASPLAHPSSLVLPVLTLLGATLAFCIRHVRACVVETLRQDYVEMARLGGVRERGVLWRYALRNALAPSVQAFAQSAQYLLGAIVVEEVLFAYPGVGKLLVEAVQTRDVVMVQAIAVILAAAYLVIYLLADLIVVLLVPKLRTAVGS